MAWSFPIVLEGTKVLVTGGAGFIGSSLVERLVPRNDVTVLDDLSTGSLENLAAVPGTVHVIRASILDRKAALRAAKGCSVVFHLAARTSVAESFEDPGRYADVNVIGTANILAAALQARAQSFVFASSCAVYGPSRSPAIPETARPNPKSPYASSKLAGEQLCDAATSPELGVVKLRVFNVYGPRQSSSSSYASVIARFVDAALAGRPIEVHGTGNQTRDFVYVDDAARALELAASSRRARGQVFNIGSGRDRSVNDVVAVLEKIGKTRIERVRRERRAGDIQRSCADVGKARRILGFRATTDLEEGLRLVVEAQARGNAA